MTEPHEKRTLKVSLILNSDFIEKLSKITAIGIFGYKCINVTNIQRNFLWTKMTPAVDPYSSEMTTELPTLNDGTLCSLARFWCVLFSSISK